MADAAYEKPGRREGRAAWLDDVQVVRNLDVNTTGKHKVWTAARRLRDYLEAEEGRLGLRRPGLRVLELGAGCGWLGLTLAANLPNTTVVLTEQEAGGAVEHLRDNISANAALVGDRVAAAALDWERCLDPHPVSPPSSCSTAGVAETNAALLAQRWDLIIGSDLVYNEVGVGLLPRVMARLVAVNCGTETPPPQLLYGHTRGRFELYDAAFLENLAGAGLAVAEVEAGGRAVPVLPGCAELEELFPELRPVVFRIQLAEPGLQ